MFKFFKRQNIEGHNRGFTLIELLIVVGILAVLSTTAVVFLNPLGQLQQARDSNRLTGLESVRQTLSLLNLGNSPPSFGSSNVIYVSLPDNVSPTCASWNLPAPPTGWSYACQSEANFKKVNGSGWLPIDLTSTTFSTTSAVLPTDPQNNTTNYYYYVYDSTTGAYELGAVLEADKNQTLAINDGGDNPGFWELGSRLSLYPTTGSLAVNNESNQPVTNESSLLAYAQAALTGQVAYFIGTNQITGSNDFFWNDSTKKLTVAGIVESTVGGVKFPDGTTQTTAATGGGVSYPTFQTLTSTTSSIYTTPVGVTELRIRMCGAGAGGGATSQGSDGTATIFGSGVTTTANGGLGGGSGGSAFAGGVGGSGGVTNLGTTIFRVAGGGAGGSGPIVTGYSFATGGVGGSSPFGGAGGGANNSLGMNAAANSCSGGGGAGFTNSTYNVGGHGGGAGEYVEFVIVNPAASYGYSVGVGGLKQGTGGNGANGVILVEEFYH